MIKDKNKEQDIEYAFNQLYLQYSGKIYNFIMRNSNGNEYLAEEVLQTVFMKIWERREHFDDYSLLKPYLFSVVRNTFYKMCAHEAVKYAYENYLKKNDLVDGIEEGKINIDEGIIREAIMALTEQMPERRRKVFYKNRIENKSYNTIAEEMNISEKTVGSHMTLALRFLREHLRDYANIIICLLFIL